MVYLDIFSKKHDPLHRFWQKFNVITDNVINKFM